jgi:hypothetical protein
VKACEWRRYLTVGERLTTVGRAVAAAAATVCFNVAVNEPSATRLRSVCAQSSHSKQSRDGKDACEGERRVGRYTQGGPYVVHRGER